MTSEMVFADVGIICVFILVIQSLKAICITQFGPMIGRKIFKLQNEQTTRFSKKIWELIWYTFCLSIELHLFIPSEFWLSIWNPFNEQYGTSLLWTYQSRNEAIPFAIRLLYLWKIAFFTSDQIYIMLIERPKTKIDFIMQSIHHIFGLILLCLSYLLPSCWKIGCGILLIHEIGEVSLFFCITLYNVGYVFIADICLPINTLIWIITRLIWSARINSSLYIDIASDDIHNYSLEFVSCSSLLWTIFVFQIYWIYKFMKIIMSDVIPKYNYGTNLHNHPKIVAFLQLIIVFIGSFMTYKLSINSINVHLDSIFKYFMMIIELISIPLIINGVCGTVGLLYPTMGIKSNYNDNTLIIFRFVTKGLYPNLMHMNIKENWKVLKQYNNIKIEIVTDKTININPKLYGIPSDVFNEIVVPSKYETPNRSLFKAKALYYAAKHSKFATNDMNCYIFHCDEESVVTNELLIGIKEFVTNHFGKIGQGLITYKNDEYSISSYFCHLADSLVTGCTCTMLRFQLKILNKAVFGYKGSFMLIPNEIEMNEMTSFDCCGKYGSITEDHWWAFTQICHNNKFEWCDGTLIEQSAFDINDLIKQRKRWMSGLLLVIFYHPFNFKQKFFFMLRMFQYWIGIFMGILIFINLVCYQTLLPQTGYSHNMITFIGNYRVFIFVTEYIMGHLLLIHKNYFEKCVLSIVMLFVFPIFMFIEGFAFVSALVSMDKSFNVIRKEGYAIQKRTKKLMKNQ